MYLVEDARLASPTQLAGTQRHRKFFASPFSKEYVRPEMPVAAPVSAAVVVEIAEAPPIEESVMVRKYTPGFASDFVKAACAVCGEKYNVEPRDIIGRLRNANIVRARHAAIFVLRNITLWSLPEIGRRVGNRDHTTILHALRKMERQAKDPEFAAILETLKAKTIEQLQADGVEAPVSPFGEQYVPQQQEAREGADFNAGGESLEGGMRMDNQGAESAKI